MGGEWEQSNALMPWLLAATMSLRTLTYLVMIPLWPKFQHMAPGTAPQQRTTPQAECWIGQRPHLWTPETQLCVLGSCDPHPRPCWWFQDPHFSSGSLGVYHRYWAGFLFNPLKHKKLIFLARGAMCLTPTFEYSWQGLTHSSQKKTTVYDPKLSYCSKGDTACFQDVHCHFPQSGECLLSMALGWFLSSSFTKEKKGAEKRSF